MKAFVALVSGALLAGPAFAQSEPVHGAHFDQGISSAPGDTHRTGDMNERGERLICRNQASTSASRMGARRVCHTQAEWREISRQAGD